MKENHSIGNNMMKPFTTALVWLGLLMVIGWQGCMPDRMPPAPVEIDRPEFLGFAPQDSGVLNVPLTDPVIMFFNEEMDVSTFPDNFELTSISGAILGTFSKPDSNKHVVIFTPSEPMNPAEVYHATVHGGVKDIHGNSMISPIKEDEPQSTWFFTTGQYAEGGFPHVFVTDKVAGDRLYLVGNLNQYLQAYDGVVSTSSRMRVTPDGSKLLVTNTEINGTVTVIDPATLQVKATIPVDRGPDDIFVTNTQAFVVNKSERSISVIDLTTFQVTTTITFTDGFRPRDIVYSEATGKIFVSSNSLSNYGTIRVIEAADPTNYHDLTNVLPRKRSRDMEISPDGGTIFIAEDYTPTVVILDARSEEVLNTLSLEFTRTVDGCVGPSAYYVAMYGGGVYKIGYQSLEVEGVADLGKTLNAVAATAAGELLYVVAPVDSTVSLVETSTMTRISEVKVPGTLKRVAVSVNNY